MTIGTNENIRAVLRRTGGVAAVSASCAALAACGSDDGALADATGGRPFSVSTSARFEPAQRLGRPETLRIVVRNRDTRPMPDVSVTLRGLDRDAPESGSAIGGISDPRRSVWIVETTPTGASTSVTRTWALGRLAPGATRVFRWRLTPTVAGSHDLRWAVAGGVDDVGAVSRGSGVLRVRVPSGVSR